jgi:tellurite resistance protein TehA-like permease
VKKRIYYATLAFVVFAVIILLIHGNELFNTINFTVGTVITVVFCIYYFFELFQKTEAQSLRRLTSFWLVSGILFNVVLIFPIFALISFMDNLSKANQKTTRIVLDHIETIFNIISVLTYIPYSTGFISRIRTSKSIP